MKRGTTMVLKRLFVTALSALGLGALAVGTAQEIPVPDVIEDLGHCTMRVPSGMVLSTPSVVARGADTSLLDDLIKAGNIPEDNTDDSTLTPTRL